MRSQQSAFVSIALAACILIAITALCLAIWNAYRISQITDQVEDAADRATPSMAEAMPPIEPVTDEIPAVKKTTEYREIGGHRFQFATGEQPVAEGPEREVAVPEDRADAGEGVQGLQARRPRPHPPGAAPRPPLPHLPQRVEAQ